VERRDRIKRFVATPLGRVTLLAISTLTLALAFVYAGPFVAIPTFLVFGLALPIYLGWKRPRSLALAGLAALLVAAPISAVLETQMLLVPSPPASSFDRLPYGNGGAVLQNATVSPFSAPSGAPFTFRVTVEPAHLPPNTRLLWVELFVSTCPDATGNRTPPDCNVGFPYYERNYTFSSAPVSETPLTFVQPLVGTNIWWWTMIAGYHNLTSGQNGSILLFPSTGYPTVQGPVTGDFFSTLGLVVPSVYIGMLFYPGSVFFFALLIYMFFKARERRRAAARLGTPAGPSGPTVPSAPEGAGPPESSTAVEERACPNCRAVVYAGETNCWKCGRPLSKTDRPLPSGGSGPGSDGT
jgi:hypothetical protein